MLGSVLDLLDFKASRTRPILVALALLSWMVPLASILPPATLSVQSVTTPEHTQIPAPIPRFDGVSMAVLNPWGRFEAGGGILSAREYLRPTRQIARLVTATAYRGAVPDHHTAFPNSTYMLDFPGPAMRCQVVPSDLLHAFNDVMNCSFVPGKDDDEPKVECENLLTYISWVPGLKHTHGGENDSTRVDTVESTIPFEPSSMIDGNLPSESYLTHDDRYIGGFGGGAASVYLATRSRRLPFDFNNWDVLNCSMYNASYSVNVTSDPNSRSTLSNLKIRTLNSIPLDVVSAWTPASDAPLSATYSATFGSLALMESLNRLIIGTIFGSAVSTFGYYTAEALTVQNQGFQQTLLPFTAELLPFQALTYSRRSNLVLPDTRQWTEVDTFGISGDTYTVSYLNEAFLSPTFNRSLASVVEELF